MVSSILKKRKAQTAPGILLGVGTVMFLFLLISVFTLNNQIKLNEREDYIEKRSECLKMANLINSIYITGPGSEIRTHTDFLITAFNSSQLSVENLDSIESYGDTPRIAFLASEAGPTSQDFYNQVNDQLDPDPAWYKACFSDLDGSGCGWSGTGWMETLIPNNIDDLMNNLDDYNTIYLEDPTMYYTFDYLDRLSQWVSQGNALILSEHIMCRERSDDTYSDTSYRCNPDGAYNEDIWQIFGVTLHQQSGASGWPNTYNVVVTETDESFDLALGDQLSFEERSFINNEATLEDNEAENLILSGGYSSSTSCECSSASGGACARHTGSVVSEGNISLDSFQNETGQYIVVIRYCDEVDDSSRADNYSFYINNNNIRSWQSSRGYGSGRIWREESIVVNISNGDNVRIGAYRGSSSSNARVDWVEVKSSSTDNDFKTIAKYRDVSWLYESRDQPAIAYWSYGAGKIFYFADFQVNYINLPSKDFSQVLVDLISTAYYLIAHPEQNSDIFCSFSAFMPYTQVYGDIIIKNVDNYIVMENVDNASIN